MVAALHLVYVVLACRPRYVKGNAVVFAHGCSESINHRCIAGPAEDLQRGVHDGFDERVRAAALDLGSVADDGVSDRAVLCACRSRR